MAGRGTAEQCLAMAKDAVTSGSAMERLAMMIAGQGGDASVTEHPEKLALSACSRTLKAERGGWISAMHSEEIGRASVLLGAGRMTKADSIDPGAGIRLTAQYGDRIAQGDPLMTLYAQKESQLDEAEAFLQGAVCIAETEPEQRPLIRKIYSTGDAI